MSRQVIIPDFADDEDQQIFDFIKEALSDEGYSFKESEDGNTITLEAESDDESEDESED